MEPPLQELAPGFGSPNAEPRKRGAEVLINLKARTDLMRFYMRRVSQCGKWRSQSVALGQSRRFRPDPTMSAPSPIMTIPATCRDGQNGPQAEIAPLPFPVVSVLLSWILKFIVRRHQWRLRMARGTVKWFNSQKGYGFIQPENGGGKDVFVHISAVERAGLNGLNEGQIVEYEEVANKGKTSAENLKVQR